MREGREGGREGEGVAKKQNKYTVVE